jgi:uncharacterized damage-inducible protein DinB
MRRYLLIFGATALLMCAQATMFAQLPSTNTEAPKPVLGPSQAVLEAWNDIGDKLTTMAEDFPEDKYDFKATPLQRTFADVLLHVAGTSYVFTDTAQGKEARPHDLARNNYKTKADIVALLKRAVADGARIIQEKGDSGINNTVRLSFGNQMVRVSDLAYSMSMHASEHYGQLVVYYRLNGLVPPESRQK